MFLYIYIYICVYTWDDGTRWTYASADLAVPTDFAAFGGRVRPQSLQLSLSIYTYAHIYTYV